MAKSAARPPPPAEPFVSKKLAAGGTRRSPPGFGVGRAFRCLAILAQRRARRPVSRAGTSNNCVGAVQTERAITSLVKKLSVDERSQQDLARFRVETPQPLGLRRRQPQTRHFQVLPSHPPQSIVYSHISVRQGHVCQLRLCAGRERVGIEPSNGHADRAVGLEAGIRAGSVGGAVRPEAMR
jgi:hypothetical protein